MRAVLFILILLLAAACKNLEDVSPADRTTFSYFYGGSTSRTGQAAIMSEDGGFLVAGNTLVDTDAKIILIKTDKLGRPVWEKTIDGGTVSSIKLLSDGYVLAGDSIKLNPQSERISELVNTKARVIRMDFNGNITKDFSFDDQLSAEQKIDYSCDAISVGTNNELVVVGTFKVPGAFERTFVAALDAASLAIKWSNQFGLLDKDYVNGRSVQVQSNGNIIWASSVLREQQNFTRSYLVVPSVQPNSSFTNSDNYGLLTDQELFGNDIQIAKAGISSYGIIGTYASPTGDGANLFFARVGQTGNIETESVRFFDGNLSIDNTAVSSAQSESEDTGDALAATADGGFILAGSMATTIVRGNGDKDIWLIKVDAFGNIQWNKLLGGSFAESVSTIAETPDGGFLICGTHTFSGLAQMFIYRTDKNGELSH